MAEERKNEGAGKQFKYVNYIHMVKKKRIKKRGKARTVHLCTIHVYKTTHVNEKIDVNKWT